MAIILNIPGVISKPVKDIVHGVLWDGIIVLSRRSLNTFSRYIGLKGQLMKESHNLLKVPLFIRFTTYAGAI